MNGHDQVRSHARRHSSQHPTPSEFSARTKPCCCDSVHATAASPQTATTPGTLPQRTTARLLSPSTRQTALLATWHSPSTIRSQRLTKLTDHCLLPPATSVQCPRMTEQVKPDGGWTRNRPVSRIPEKHCPTRMMPLRNSSSSSPLIPQKNRIPLPGRRCRKHQRTDFCFTCRHRASQSDLTVA